MQAFVNLNDADEDTVLADILQMREIVFNKLPEEKVRKYNHDAVTYLVEIGIPSVLAAVHDNLVGSVAMTEMISLLDLIKCARRSLSPAPKPVSELSAQERIDAAREGKENRAALELDRVAFAASLPTINSEMDKIKGREWHESSATSRKIIDKELMKGLYYYNKSISHCICCYTKFDSKKSPGSHIITEWYLMKVLNSGLLATKFDLADTPNMLQANPSQKSMVMRMLCSQCEQKQGIMESSVADNKAAVTALRCLKTTGRMPGESTYAQYSQNSVFLTKTDGLKQTELYQFLGCNMMRLLATLLDKVEYAEMWILFDSLRAQLLSNMYSDSLGATISQLCMYVVPVGGEIYLSLVEKSLRKMYIVPADMKQVDIFKVVINGCLCGVMFMNPLVVVISLQSIEQLSNFRVHNAGIGDVSITMRTEQFTMDKVHHIYDHLHHSLRTSVVSACQSSNCISLRTVKSCEEGKISFFCTESFRSVINNARDNPLVLEVLTCVFDKFQRHITRERYNDVISRCVQKDDGLLALYYLPFEECHGFVMLVLAQLFVFPGNHMVQTVIDARERLLRELNCAVVYRQICFCLDAYHTYILRVCKCYFALQIL